MTVMLLLEIYMYTNIAINFYGFFVTYICWSCVNFQLRFMRRATLSFLNYASRCHGLRLSVLNKETTYLLTYDRAINNGRSSFVDNAT